MEGRHPDREASGAALPAARTTRETLKAIAMDGPTIDRDGPTASGRPSVRSNATLFAGARSDEATPLRLTGTDSFSLLVVSRTLGAGHQ